MKIRFADSCAFASQINDIQCNTPHDGNWGYAIANEIQDGINYLRSLTGDCTATPGPCGRVSCSWNSGIGYVELDLTSNTYSLLFAMHKLELKAHWQ